MLRRTLLVLSIALSVFAVARAQLDNGAPLPAIQQLVPQPASNVPPTETIPGAAGAANTFRRGDAVQPRITRAGSCTTSAAGTCSVTYDVLSVAPVMTLTPMVASNATQVNVCQPVSGTITTTTATFKCMTSQSSAVSILGINILPFANTAAGVTVQFLAVPPTP